MLEMFTKESFTAQNASNEYEFTGAKTIRVTSPQTQDYGDYTRSGTSRYGTPTDVQDTVQEMSLTQDKSFALVIDKGDNSQQMMMKNAGKVMRLQQRDKGAPMIDKYNLKMWARGAGKVVAMADLSKTTIVAALLAAETYLDNSLVPAENRIAYVKNTHYAAFRQASEFTGCDNIVEKLIMKGWRGNLGTLHIVAVPDSYMPTNVHFLVTYKNSVIAPHTIADARIHQDPPGISGHLLEGRDIFDAFVLGQRCDGVYAAVLTAKAATTPTATKGETTTALAAGTGEVIKYTLDGTDPRYSFTAKTYTSAFANPAAGVVIKAFAQLYDSNIYNSALLEHTCE
jgi:hypothetical protein